MHWTTSVIIGSPCHVDCTFDNGLYYDGFDLGAAGLAISWGRFLAWHKSFYNIFLKQ